MRETVKRVQDGAVGKIVALQGNYNARGLWRRDRQPGWSDMEWQLRNWLYFTWLSGDHNVEQHVHTLDKLAWVLGDQYPVNCFGLGGRQARTAPEYGNIFDHHAVCYEFPGGVRGFAYTRQQDGTATETEDYVFGSTGTAKLIGHQITGETNWKFRPSRGQKVDMYQQEHNELFASIRSGSPINNGDYMSKSTLMAIMGRMATYTGQVITWEQALNSKEDLTPQAYEFSAMPVPPVAVPGVTKFS
jgi:predicted dehydrogenase